MKTIFDAHTWLSMLGLTLSLLTVGCASFTYQEEEWRVAIVDNTQSDVTVRYSGVGTTSTDPDTRRARLERLRTAVADNSGPVFTPRLRNVSRRLYQEDGVLVLEESGTMRNPLSWFAQTSMNPLYWFNDPLNLAIRGNMVVKRDIDKNRQILASNGHVTDETTFQTIHLRNVPFELGSDRAWQLRDEEPVDREIREPQELRLIVWPDEARFFYWKFSGPSFGNDGVSLLPEYIDALTAPLE